MKHQYGEFSAQGDQFFVQRIDTPQPWHNHLVSQKLATQISQTGAGSLRLLGNAPPVAGDRMLFIRDSDRNESWSALGTDATKFDHFQAVHSPNFTRIESAFASVGVAATVFLPPETPCEIWHIRISNQSKQKRRLSVFAGVTWTDDATTTFETTQAGGILFGLERSAQNTPVRFVTASRTIDSFETQAKAFTGRRGSFQEPEAVAEGKLSRSIGSGDQAIAVLQINLTLGAGDETQFCFLSGALSTKGTTTARQFTDAQRQAKALRQEYQRANAVTESLTLIETAGATVQGRALVKSGDASFDSFFNYWLKHQGQIAHALASDRETLLCTAASLCALDPASTAQTLRKVFAQQHRDGSLPNEQGSDDSLLLISVTTTYITETADLAFLDEKIAYLDADDASVLHHLIRAADRSLKSLSSRGLPAQQTISLAEKSSGTYEQLETACELYAALRGLIPLLDAVGEHELVHSYDRASDKLKVTINDHFWQGSWYAAELKNGRPVLGIAKSDHYRIGLADQARAILSGVSNRERGQRALNHAVQALSTKYGPLNFKPPFAVVTENPLSADAPGCNENSTVLSRSSALATAAWAKLGAGDEAFRTWQRCCPAALAANPEVYQAEPFAVSKYIAGPHQSTFGRGSGFAIDGSAALFWKTLLESILGVQPTLGGLKIDPCLPRDWRQVELTRQFRNAEYHIRIINSLRANRGVDRILVDGVRITGTVIPVHSSGIHFVEAILG